MCMFFFFISESQATIVALTRAPANSANVLSTNSLTLQSAVQLCGGFKYFYFHSHLGKIPILTNIFQMD